MVNTTDKDRSASVTPLIGGEACFSGLQQAIRDASDTIFLAYWTVDPDFSADARVGDGSKRDDDEDRWIDLLLQKAEQGVEIRLIITDFDPILGRHYHRQSWRAYRRIMQIRSAWPADVRKRMQVFCSRHAARTGTLPRLAMQPLVWREFSQLCRELNTLPHGTERGIVSCWPGLWGNLARHDTSRKRGGWQWRPWPIPTLHPAVHHEKLCVIDDRIAFVGGVDIDRDRLDNTAHEDARAWHDVALRIEDTEIARFFGQHFRYRWNVELAGYVTWLDELAPPPDGVPHLPLCEALRPFAEAPSTAPEPVTSSDGHLTPLRTSTRQQKASFALVPRKTVNCEILHGMKALIADCNRELYIETQYFRSRAIADAICKRAMDNPDLTVTLILPWLPEDVQHTNDPDEISRDGQHLQRAIITQLRSCMGDRFGAYSLLRGHGEGPDPKASHKRLLEDIIYVHAKLMVADRRCAIVGSANLNTRSMLMDTETALRWSDAPAVEKFWIGLVRHALGDEVKINNHPILTQCRHIAARNRTGSRNRKNGFLVPLPDEIADAFARPMPGLPEELS